MKKPKKRAAQKQKRVQRRREQRRKRKHEQMQGGGGPHPRGAPGLRTWATDPLAMSIGGRGTVAVLVPEGARSWLVGVRFDLLAGGYLDTCDTRVAGAFALSTPSWSASDEIGGRLFGTDGELAVWGRHLRPAPVSLASRLVWGAVAYRAACGLEVGGSMPALGHLPPPPGNPSAWLMSFADRFAGSQFEVAEILYEEQLQRSEAGLAPAAPLIRVEVGLETEAPLAASVELDRRPLEFFSLPGGGAMLGWVWMPLSSRTPSLSSALAPRRPRGLVWMHSSGDMVLMALGTDAASEMALRLEALVPSLRFRACHWSLGDEYSNDEADLELDSTRGGLVVPREAAG